MSRVCILLVLIILFEQGKVWAQYEHPKIQVGMKVGNRGLGLQDFNEYQGGFQSMKPLTNNNCVSLSAQVSPFKKNRLYFKLQYEWLPDIYQKGTTHWHDSIDWTKYGGTGVTYQDDYLHFASKVSMQTSAVTCGYDFPIKNKFFFDGELGVSYNTFSLVTTMNETEFSRNNQSATYESTMPDRQWLAAKGNNFGAMFSATAGYKITQKLYAHVSLTLHIADLTLYDSQGNTYWMDPGRYGLPFLGYIYYDRNLNADLSGVMIGFGVSYVAW